MKNELISFGPTEQVRKARCMPLRKATGKILIPLAREISTRRRLDPELRKLLLNEASLNEPGDGEVGSFPDGAEELGQPVALAGRLEIELGRKDYAIKVVPSFPKLRFRKPHAFPRFRIRSAQGFPGAAAILREGRKCRKASAGIAGQGGRKL